MGGAFVVSCFASPSRLTATGASLYIYNVSSDPPSCVLRNPGQGFAARAGGSKQVSTTAYFKVTGYSVSGAGAFSAGSGFNANTGDFTAQRSGFHFFVANAYLANADSGECEVLLTVNDRTTETGVGYRGLGWSVSSYGGRFGW